MKHFSLLMLFVSLALLGSCKKNTQVIEQEIRSPAAITFSNYEITNTVTKKDGCYKVIQNLIIYKSGTLILQPGVKLLFAENTGIICMGKLIALGSKDKPIEFTADNKQSGWNNIVFKGENTNGSILDYAQITFGKGIPLTHNAISDIKQKVYDDEEFHDYFDADKYRIGGGVLCCDNASVVFQNSLIACNSANSVGGGVCSFSSSISFDKCEFSKNFLIPVVDLKDEEDPFSNSIAGSAIYCSNSDKTTLKNCVVEYNNGNNEFSASHGTIACVNESEMIIENCTITKNSIKGTAYTGGGGIWLDDSKLEIAVSKIEYNTIDGNGGGLMILNSYVTIKKCFIKNNICGYGGGICFGLKFHGAESNCTINDCVIDNNEAMGDGGGIYGELLDIELVNTSISNNKAKVGTGGAIFLIGSFIESTDCLFIGNVAKDTGGIELSGQCTRYFRNCKIERNSGGFCGGVYLRGGNTIKFTDCSISNNYSSNGSGGINFNNASAIFKRCTVCRNESKTIGGGMTIYNADAKIIFNECEITENVAKAKGGGIYIDKTDKNVEYTNTTIENNSPDNIYIEK